MITFVRTGDFNDGKALAAIAWALKVAAYVNGKYGTNISVQQNVGGKINQVHWVATFESMNESVDLGDQLIQDEGYQELITEANNQGLFAANSIVDNHYRTIG
jgi:hypothetical protein